MHISYKKLFHMLIDRDVSPSELQKDAGFSRNILTRLRRNEFVSLESIASICRVLNCGVDEILEFQFDEEVSE